MILDLNKSQNDDCEKKVNEEDDCPDLGKISIDNTEVSQLIHNNSIKY